jgi:copper resistance protein D
MILDKFVHSAPTLFDLLALTTCIGALSCRIWVLQTVSNGRDKREERRLLASVWKLIGFSAAMLVLSSSIILSTRSTEMSGLPFADSSTVIPRVLFNTHYGHVWLIRVAAVAVLCAVWLIGGRDLYSRRYSMYMLIVAAAMAATRSASGHAADAGDFSLPEISDWLHLMSASIWGGGLITLSLAVFPEVLRRSGERRELIAEIALRFSRLAAIALFTIVITAAYNGWFEVGSVKALFETAYGKIIMVKIGLLVVLVILAASNRYISIPHITGLSLTREDNNGAISWLIRRVRAETVLIAALLVCTALLLHNMPAKNLSHAGHEHMHNVGK